MLAPLHCGLHRPSAQENERQAHQETQGHLRRQPRAAVHPAAAHRHAAHARDRRPAARRAPARAGRGEVDDRVLATAVITATAIVTITTSTVASTNPSSGAEDLSVADADIAAAAALCHATAMPLPCRCRAGASTPSQTRQLWCLQSRLRGFATSSFVFCWSRDAQLASTCGCLLRSSRCLDARRRSWLAQEVLQALSFIDSSRLVILPLPFGQIRSTAMQHQMEQMSLLEARKYNLPMGAGTH